MSHRMPTRRRAAALLASAGIVVAALSPAYASERLGTAEPHPAGPSNAEYASASASAGSPSRIETFRDVRPVGPGIELTTVDQYGPDGYTGEPTWLQSHTLSVDLTSGVQIDRIFPGKVAATAPLGEMADEAGAVAAVNADYFDIAGSGAPWGVGIQSGELLHSPLPNTRAATTENAVMFGEDNLGAIGEIVFEGSVILPDGDTVSLDALNKAELLPGQIGMFTSVWGTYCRCRPTEGAGRSIEVVVSGGVVTDVASAPRAGTIDDDAFVLVGREDGADALSRLEIGDPVAVDYDVRAPGDMQVKAAMSGRQLLVVDGEPEKLPAANNTPEPRTAVGFSEDGTQMWLVAVDGRQPEFSRGIGLDELAEAMVDLGAHTALNLDGGGSTTMVARDPGRDDVRLVNRPSDAAGQRPVPTGLAMFVPKGSGKLSGYWVRTMLDPDPAAGSAFQPRIRTERVFPGLTRRLTADGHDETYGPATERAAASRHWRTDDRRTGVVDRAGVFTGLRPGRSTVTVRSGAASGKIDLTVLGELTRLEASPAVIGLTEPGATAGFSITGYDAQGYAAPIETADITLEYDESALEVIADEDGTFRITALDAEGEQFVTVTAGGVSTSVPVGLGMQEVVVDSFDDTSNWDFWSLRATGSLSSTEAGYEGRGLQLDFDFTQDTLIRGVGVWPAENLLPVPGEPSAFKVWIHSEGQRLRARLEVVDRHGQLSTIEPGFINEPGWHHLTYEVPAGIAYPISLRRIYVNELDPAASYHGTLILDELTAVVPREVDVAQAPPAPDPVVVFGRSPGVADTRFAVLSDAGVEAADRDGRAAQNVRRALREIAAADVDVVIVNGGLVASGTQANLAFARELLEDELPADVAYHYVPGEAERSSGSLAGFAAEFGAVPRTIDVAGVRFVLLDSSNLSYRDSDWTQLAWLREELASAGADADVSAVVVVQNVPLRDPDRASVAQLMDRKESATVEGWLTELRESSGKDVVLVGAHAGRFHAERIDGVPYVTNGPIASASGEQPGGFAGWAHWHLGGDASLRTEFVARVDEVSITGPSSLAVGESALLEATITQDGRQIPVRYPMATTWSGSDGVHVGSPGEATGRHAAVLDPMTGELTALTAQTVTVAVTVNGEAAELTVELTD